MIRDFLQPLGRCYGLIYARQTKLKSGNKGYFPAVLFLTVFRHFSVSEYCKYSRTSRNIVRFTTSMTNSAKGCGSPADRCRDFLAVNNWHSNFAHNARKTNKDTLLRPESKRPLKSQIGRLCSTPKKEHTFAAVQALRPGSAPAAQSKHDKKSRKRLYIIIISPYRRPVNREY